MARNTRYDKLARKVRRDFERAKTFTNDSSINADGFEVFVNALAEHWRADNEQFANFRPYNTINVDNDSTQTVRVFLNEQDTWFFDVGSGETRSLTTPMYFTFVKVQEQDSGSISSDQLQVTVGKAIDSREMELLKMAGMLDVQ